MKCRHCDQQLHHVCLDLGTSPPSNSYLLPQQLAEPELYFPLRLLFCESCYLVQTEDFTQRELLFDKDYSYFSSFSSSWLAHAKTYVHAMRDRFSLNQQSVVVEVAANDGYLLQYVKELDIPCFGVEPTESTARVAQERGIEIISEFFGRELAMKLANQGRQADLIAANNVLAHVPDINDFVSGFAMLLKDTGVATFEFPHLYNMVRLNQFDTAYHEHFSYLSLSSVKNIFEANGLRIFDVEELATHGGSLRVYAQKSSHRDIEERVHQLLALETQAGMHSISFYEDFQAATENIKNDVLQYLITCKKAGLKVAAYGAAAKGNTLLNFAGVRADLLAYVVDKNPQKQGKCLPGSRIPIVNEMHLVNDKPDRVLILPWNLKDEITRDLSYISEWNAKFVCMLPQLHEVDAH
nr:class I SAM-dependent methyltransferase [uncultured Undibacterium sp.]